MLPDQGSNLESSDSESGVLPIPPSGKRGLGLGVGVGVYCKGKFKTKRFIWQALFIHFRP